MKELQHLVSTHLRLLNYILDIRNTGSLTAYLANNLVLIPLTARLRPQLFADWLNLLDTGTP